MKILAIDTTSTVCSTAVLEDNKLIDENTINNGLTHSENLMPLIDELLKRNNILLKDIDLIAVCVGPGSFTGIRIGISSIKAISEVYNIPIVSVTSLEVLAEASEKSQTIISLIDARNNQVYAGFFDDKINKLEEFIADDINNVLEIASKYNNIIFIGNGSLLHKQLIKNKIENCKFCNKNEQNAYFVGINGYKKFKNDILENADSIKPIYLRNKS